MCRTLDLVFLFMLLLGCDEPPNRAWRQVDLTRVDAWQAVAASEDVFADHRPTDVECGGAGAFVEDGILEVDTGRCTYFAASQPLLVDLKTNQTLLLTIYHDDLFSEVRGAAHLALVIEDDVLWETEIPIPAASRLVTYRIPVTRPYEVGRHLYFHLHNHGVNHWRLVSLSVEAMDGVDPL